MSVILHEQLSSPQLSPLASQLKLEVGLLNPISPSRSHNLSVPRVKVEIGHYYVS
jgi:hypothetical protein